MADEINRGVYDLLTTKDPESMQTHRENIMGYLMYLNQKMAEEQREMEKYAKKGKRLIGPLTRLQEDILIEMNPPKKNQKGPIPSIPRKSSEMDDFDFGQAILNQLNQRLK